MDATGLKDIYPITADIILKLQPDYGVTKEYEFQPGVTLKIRGIQSFSELRAIGDRVQKIKALGGAAVDIGNGVTAAVDDETMWACVYVQSAIVGPPFDYSQIVGLAFRAGAQFGLLQAEIAKLSGLALDAAVDAAGVEVAQDPFPADGAVSSDEDALLAVGSGGVAGAGHSDSGMVDEGRSQSE